MITPILSDAKPKHSSVKPLWLPDQVLFTPAALAEPWGRKILERVESFSLPVEVMKSNRITGLRGKDERETYKVSKRTFAVVTSPQSKMKLTPIPPSADWQFHLAEGCPAHCKYCYLAGSLSGPPVIRAFANLPQILENLLHYEQDGKISSFEVSCYTDPLGIEHLTGSLAECIRFFGTQFHQKSGGQLRWISKFDSVESLLELPHNGNTRCRVSVNALPLSTQLEGGTASVSDRLRALRRLALPTCEGGGGYPAGIVIAPIMPMENWEHHYGHLLDMIASSLDFDCDLTFELITHRFTPGSKAVLQGWYPYSPLDLDKSSRKVKQNKFGGIKYVYDSPTMNLLKNFFKRQIQLRFPKAVILYWT